MIEDFKIKEKISDFLGYSYLVIEKFPNKHRILKDHIFNIFFTLYDTAIQLQYEKKNHQRWEYIQNLDRQLNRLKHFIRFANDRKYFPHPNTPPLANKTYEVMSRLMTEIGQMINGYMNSLTPINPELKKREKRNSNRRGPIKPINNPHSSIPNPSYVMESNNQRIQTTEYVQPMSNPNILNGTTATTITQQNVALPQQQTYYNYYQHNIDNNYYPYS